MKQQNRFGSFAASLVKLEIAYYKGQKPQTSWFGHPSPKPLCPNAKESCSLCLLLHTEVEAKGESDILSESQLSAMVNKPELIKITHKHGPAGTWAFWYPESEMDKTELQTGQEVRLKTRGNGPFICESGCDCIPVEVSDIKLF